MKNIQQYYRNKTKESCRECKIPFCNALCPVLDTPMKYLEVGLLDWIILPNNRNAPQGMIFDFDPPDVMTIIEVSPKSVDTSLGDKWIVKPNPEDPEDHYLGLRQIYRSRNSTVILTRCEDRNIDDYIKLVESEKCQYYDCNKKNLGVNYAQYIECNNNRLELIVNVPQEVSIVSVVDKLNKLDATHHNCEIKIISNRQT